MILRYFQKLAWIIDIGVQYRKNIMHANSAIVEHTVKRNFLI